MIEVASPSISLVLYTILLYKQYTKTIMDYTEIKLNYVEWNELGRNELNKLLGYHLITGVYHIKDQFS